MWRVVLQTPVNSFLFNSWYSVKESRYPCYGHLKHIILAASNVTPPTCSLNLLLGRGIQSKETMDRDASLFIYLTDFFLSISFPAWFLPTVS